MFKSTSLFYSFNYFPKAANNSCRLNRIDDELDAIQLVPWNYKAVQNLRTQQLLQPLHNMIKTAQHQTRENPHVCLFHLYYPNVPLILSTMNSLRLPHPHLTAQTIRLFPVEPDVGVAVGVSSMFYVFEKPMTSPSLWRIYTDMAINIVFALVKLFERMRQLKRIATLPRWSKQTLIIMLPILIATVSSIGNPSFDPLYAVAVTAPPITVYLIYSYIFWACRNRRARRALARSLTFTLSLFLQYAFGILKLWDTLGCSSVWNATWVQKSIVAFSKFRSPKINKSEFNLSASSCTRQ